MKLLHILQADNVENDYRLIKECKTLIDASVKPEILYFHVNNEPALIGELKIGVTWERKKLITRSISKSGSFIFIKLLEQWLRSAIFVLRKRPNIVCIHDERFFGLIPFLYIFKKFRFIDNIVWDLRELPTIFLYGSNIKKKILKKLLYLCDSVASANKERNEIIERVLNLSISEEKKLFTICNYPDEEFNLIKKKPLPNNLYDWLEGFSYIYAQSLIEPARYLYNTIDSIMLQDNLKLVITGRTDSKDIKYFKDKYGEDFKDKVFLVGLVDPYHLANYLDHSVGSIILYEDSSDNRKYCAPNRLYQSLSRGIPVIVGNNPPMSNEVKKYGSGIALESDGKNIRDIENSFIKLNEDLIKITNSAKDKKNEYVWEFQAKEVLSFFRLD